MESYNAGRGFYFLRYSDNDTEELDEEEVTAILWNEMESDDDSEYVDGSDTENTDDDEREVIDKRLATDAGKKDDKVANAEHEEVNSSYGNHSKAKPDDVISSKQARRHLVQQRKAELVESSAEPNAKQDRKLKAEPVNSSKRDRKLKAEPVNSSKRDRKLKAEPDAISSSKQPVKSSKRARRLKAEPEAINSSKQDRQSEEVESSKRARGSGEVESSKRAEEGESSKRARQSEEEEFQGFINEAEAELEEIHNSIVPRMAAMLEEARALSKNAALMHDESEVMVKTKPTRETKWSNRFKELVGYKAQHGNCLVPKRYEDNPPLGSWVSKQRVLYTRNQAGKTTTLTEERIKQLDSLGFTWVIERAHQEQWSDRFQQLEDYKVKHGNCLVPVNNEDNPQLGLWVSRQRKLYNVKLGRKMNCQRKGSNSLSPLALLG